ncbi:MAG: NAD(P)H-hydrate dehydratase [Candidatus Hodarchaeales archaeon]
MKENSISTLDMSITDVNSEYLGVNRTLLMENAGRGLADFILETCESTSCSNIIILAGKGGNGGDGMVAARHLARSNRVSLSLLGSSGEIKKRSTLLNWNILKNMYQSLELNEIKSVKDLKHYTVDSQTIVVDAIFGTGIKGEIRGLHRNAIESINFWRKNGATVISVDTPSGINPDSGLSSDIHVNAHHTCVFHRKKTGLNSTNAGNLHILPIGIPPEAETIVGPGDLLALRKENNWAKKGDKGKILIIGGNEIYSGAPALAALGALQAGSDLVTIFAPKCNATAIRSYSPELIVQDYSSSHLTKKSLELDLFNHHDAVLIGPGLGRNSEIKEAVEEVQVITEKNKIPLVIDADALHLINPSLLSSNVILTPHAGEFSVLTGVSLPSSNQSFTARVDFVKSVTKKISGIWLVKGNWDIVSEGTKTKINKTGTPKMTRGGTGDILAGLTTSFLPRVKDPFYAATISSFINGRAGELTHRNFSSLNLISKIPEAIQKSLDFINYD